MPNSSLPRVPADDVKRTVGAMPPSEWNQTSASLPLDCLVHELVVRQALARPEEIAAQDERRRLTWAGLFGQSGRWAAHLRRHGIAPGRLVALELERSLEFVVAALAVLRAGAAYLPLDPAWPRARRQRVMTESQADALLTMTRADAVADGCAQHFYWEDGPGDETAPPVETGAGPDSLAYVISTSGSTGTPKGVEITHRSLLNLVFWHGRTFAVQPGDRVSLLSPVGFDAAVWEMWPNLCAGASLHLVPEEVRPSAKRLQEWLLAEGIHLCFVASAMAEKLMELPWPQETPLRTLLTGADTLHRRPPAGLPFAVVNNYGPTECTVLATSGEVMCGDQGQLPDLGHPIANTRIYLLDEQGAPVPVGEPGEICIAGAAVARGYRNRPELTAQRFADDPWQAGERMYHTGDRGRYLPDGRIAFVGRMDDQIKLRGYRIEPQEIVEALHQHPQVKRSAVTASQAGEGEARLVAWLQLQPGTAPTPAELIAFLRERLPEYMIPAVYAAVDEFVLNENGKVAISSLPSLACALVLKDSTTDDGEAQRETGTERRVREILANLLNLDEVGAHDNFFYLGGHSLLGTQLIARVRESFGVNLSLRTLFDNPTVAGLAHEIEQRQSEAA